MPRFDHRVKIDDHFAPKERVILTVLLQLINPLRAQLHMPAIRQADLVQMIRQAMRQQA